KLLNFSRSAASRKSLDDLSRISVSVVPIAEQRLCFASLISDCVILGTALAISWVVDLIADLSRLKTDSTLLHPSSSTASDSMLSIGRLPRVTVAGLIKNTDGALTPLRIGPAVSKTERYASSNVMRMGLRGSVPLISS